MKSLTELFEATAALHYHLCPRQVLGVRMGVHAGEVLGLDLPQADKRLLAIVETDGCATDGIAVATNCWVGRRTMRIKDYGKVAATFVDTLTGRAVRLWPRPEARERAHALVREARDSWEAQLLGYQRLPAEALLSVTEVRLNAPIAEIISRPGLRVVCEECGEEIMNEREVRRAGAAVCRACAGHAYYHVLPEEDGRVGRA